MRRVYLDHNASSPLRPEARAAMAEAPGGNPSSVHAEGRAARAAVERARAQVAALVPGMDVVFTSGGTEANTLALAPEWLGVEAADAELFVSAVEHPSVLAGGAFRDVTLLPVTAAGVVDLAAARAMLGAARGRVIVSLMAANNETGVIQPTRELAQLAQERGGLLHVDAVQIAGRMPMSDLGADMITVSAHKLGGPLGVGALLIRGGLHNPRPAQRGGGQERGLRAGTENVAAIAGFGAVVQRTPMMWREAVEAEIRAVAPDAVIFGEGAERLPNTVLFAVPGMQAETLVIALDLAGIAVSAGAACASGRIAQSHVLAAMGVAPALAAGALRVSAGWSTTAEDIARFGAVWSEIYRRWTLRRAA